MEYEVQKWHEVDHCWRAISPACGDLTVSQAILQRLREEFTGNYFRLVRLQAAVYVLQLLGRRTSEYAGDGGGIYVSTICGGLGLLGRAMHFDTAAEAERAIRGLTAGTGPLPGERLAVEETFEAAPAERAWPGDGGA